MTRYLIVPCLIVVMACTAPAFAAAKPITSTKTLSAAAPGHLVNIEADITGAENLYLVITDAGDGFGCDWADWVEPMLSGGGQEKRLTELKWKSASSDFGRVQVNRNCRGDALRVNGQAVAFGIGSHANSVIHYELPKGHRYTKFVAAGGLDNGGTDQGCGSTVQFAVYTQKPPTSVNSGGVSASREPGEAIDGLEVHEDLQVELFAAEPMLANPANIDIDHRGRVWVAEAINYRGKGKREEGDRIVILEDTDGDGRADKETVFHQGNDINSAHGVTVLATPDFKNTRVIVSVGDSVFNFFDDDGDGKADRKEVMFTGISGTQHDHGIHQFIFGPDGRLYFNFGNSGRQIKDKNGKIIVDAAGNQVVANRKPYQEGMVFRCELDGSNFETLGWNFRNNWMATVDSFGSLWQSDNDDDGNRGVRINFVMEFGNYGYKDEFTGAGWQSQRPNIEQEIPLRHWHLNDPGVVPNLLNTGAGSPTGITVYEGGLLPKAFQGQVIHTDAGPNVCRAYPVENDGAGYSAEIVNILEGAKDKWYRPSDVKVAPDGSLIIADWYDPGVGGHNARSMDTGRLFRITPKGHKGYKVPKFDFSTAEGAIEALKNPNYAVRYVAWQALHAMGTRGGAKEAMTKLAQSDNPAYRARALWLLAHIESNVKGRAANTAAVAAGDDDPRIRGMALRLARQHEDVDTVAMIERMADDKSPQVRRECAIAIRDVSHGELSDSQTAKLATLWAQLAAQHDGKDRWYLEALGIGADRIWDAAFAAWLKKAGGPDKAVATAAGRDIIWRARCKAALPLLPKAAKADDQANRARYVRAFDFHPKSPEKDAALLEMLQ